MEPVPKNEVWMWRLTALSTMTWPAVIGLAALFSGGLRNMSDDRGITLTALSAFLSSLAGALLWRHARKLTTGEHPDNAVVVMWFFFFLVGTILVSPTAFFFGCIAISKVLR